MPQGPLTLAGASGATGTPAAAGAAKAPRHGHSVAAQQLTDQLIQVFTTLDRTGANGRTARGHDVHALPPAVLAALQGAGAAASDEVQLGVQGA
jgi:hypothetical protein